MLEKSLSLKDPPSAMVKKLKAPKSKPSLMVKILIF